MTQIEVFKGDITKLEVDAIVNAANKSLLGDGGVDGAIHRAAGPKLLEECKTLNGCETGKAKITKGYNLPVKYIIHTVGPIWKDGFNRERDLLESCYKSILKLVQEYNIKTIAIPAISCGICGFPIYKACYIATDAIRYFIDKNSCLDKIIFIDINDKIIKAYKKMLDINNRCQQLPIIEPHKAEWRGGLKDCKEGEIPQIPYVLYTKEDIEWIGKFGKLNLYDRNYLEHVNEYNLLEKDIFKMSREEILSLLTGYIRQDRFNEGLLANAIDSGKITELVKQLHKITKE